MFSNVSGLFKISIKKTQDNETLNLYVYDEEYEKS